MLLKHLETEKLQKYQFRQLAPAEMVATVIHLEQCQECKNKLNEMFPPKHLNYDEHILPFVEGTITETNRKIVTEHIKTCSLCLHQINDLKEFVQTNIQTDILSSETEKISFWSWSSWFDYRILAFTSIIIGVISLSWFLVFYEPTINTQNDNQVNQRIIATNSAVNNSSMIPKELPPVPQPSNVSNSSNASVAKNLENKKNVNHQINNITNTFQAKQNRKTENTLKPKNNASEVTSITLPKYLDELKTKELVFQSSEALAIQKIELNFPNGIVVKSNTPSLKWQKIEGISSYEVSIYDKNRSQLIKEVVSSNTWQVPINLKKGEIYEWQVFAVKDKHQFLGKAKFYLTSKKNDNNINKSKNAFQRGKALAEAGLLDEAKIEFEKYLEKNPRSKITKKMLKQLSKKY